jgi:hypothetical protein
MKIVRNRNKHKVSRTRTPGRGSGGGASGGGGATTGAARAPKATKPSSSPAGGTTPTTPGATGPAEDPYPAPKWDDIYGPAQREIERQRAAATAGQAGETAMWNNFNTWASDKIAAQQGLSTSANTAIAGQLDAARQDSMNKIQGYIGNAVGTGGAVGTDLSNATGATALAQSQAALGAASTADQQYQAAMAASAADKFGTQTRALGAQSSQNLNNVGMQYGAYRGQIDKSALGLDQELAKAKSQYNTDRTMFMETKRKADRQYGLDQMAAAFLNQNKATQTAIAQQNANTRAKSAEWQHADRVAANATAQAKAAAAKATKSGTAADKAKAEKAKQRAKDLKSAAGTVAKALTPTFQTDAPDVQGNVLKGIASQIHATYPNMAAQDGFRLISAVFGTRASKGNFPAVLQQIWSM